MGILGDIIRVLAKAFCGSSSADEGPPAQGQGYSGQPTYAQQAQQQPSYYPPQQQQQQPVYQPPQQPPHPHKPHHGHGNGQHAGSQPSSSPTSPSHGSPHGNGRVDQNQINQANEHYVSLRARANAEGDAMARAFDESHAAYERKDGARAKELSNEGKAHQREMERLNGEASEWIFRENNLDSKPGEIDLHGLYVKEAIAYSDRSIQEALQRGDSEIHLIVGKGLHSPHGAAKLKPAIEDLIRKHNLVAALDPQNAGVLIVQLAGGSGAERARDRGGVMLGADEITQRLGGQDEGCIVM